MTLKITVIHYLHNQQILHPLPKVQSLLRGMHMQAMDPLSSKKAMHKLCELSVCYSTEKYIEKKENRTIRTIIMTFSSIITSFILFTVGPGGCLLKYLPLSVMG